MRFKKPVKMFAITLAILLLIQISTFLLLAPQQLESKLLQEQFKNFSHTSDSAFVRDFYVTKCNVGEPESFSYNLRETEAELKEKLGVKFIKFQDPDEFSWKDSTEEKYDLVYHTWAHRWDYHSLWGFFSVTQTEELIEHRKVFSNRVARYRWILFWWVEYFEYFNTNIEVPGKIADQKGKP
jgi:hypothetical protein